MLTGTEKLIVCYSFGSGIGNREEVELVSRQLAEEFSGYLALLPKVVSISQILLHDDFRVIDGEVGRRYAIFYSLPESSLIVSRTRDLGGEYALTGRLLEWDGVWTLGVNVVDVLRGVLVFCHLESFERGALAEVLCRMGEKLVRQFGEGDVEAGLVSGMLGTGVFESFIHWCRLRDYERDVLFYGVDFVRVRVFEHCLYALQYDPHFLRASRRLIRILHDGYDEKWLDRILSLLSGVSLLDVLLGEIYCWCYYRLGRYSEGLSHLEELVKVHGRLGIFCYIEGVFLESLSVGRGFSKLEEGESEMGFELCRRVKQFWG